MNRGRLAAAAMVASTLAVALTAQRQSRPDESPRQALVEMLSGGEEKFTKHLSPEVQARLAEMRKDELPGANTPLQATSFIRNADSRKLDTFDYGPILFAINDAAQHQRLEAHIEKDELRGDRDDMDISLHSFHWGVEEDSPVLMNLSLGMKLQNSVWRVESLTLNAKLALSDPKILNNGWWNWTGAPGTDSKPVTDVAEASSREPAMPPLRAVRMIGLAENLYAQKHPDQGFTCGIKNLVNVGKGIDNGQQYQFMAPEFSDGIYNGYRFTLIGCQGKPAKSFQVTAEPVSGTGKAYCLDDRRNLRASDDGRATTCLIQGKLARR